MLQLVVYHLSSYNITIKIYTTPPPLLTDYDRYNTLNFLCI